MKKLKKSRFCDFRSEKIVIFHRSQPRNLLQEAQRRAISAVSATKWLEQELPSLAVQNHASLDKAKIKFEKFALLLLLRVQKIAHLPQQVDSTLQVTFMLTTATKSEDNISVKLKVGMDFICIELRNKINMMINIFSVKSKTTSCLLIYSARYFLRPTGGAHY